MVQYIYTLGAAGERLSVAELDRAVEYTYDDLYRLTGETITEGEKVTAYTYAYDSVGNRILKTKNGTETEYTYNELNQLVSDSDATYEYDLNGNLVRVIGGAQSALYEYNSENKLVKATVQNGSLVTKESYTYDYAGNRTSKSTSTSDGNSEFVKYLNDNSSLTNVLAELDSEGNVQAYYTIGADLISQERNGRTYTYLYDGHGSVVGLMNESGSVTDTYTYDAFGNLLKSTGRTANNYRYCGEQFDSTTGLYYLRARYMDTSTGRFISQDSYAGSVYDPVSLHKYLYANSNPVTYSDPSGYFSLGSVVCASTIGNMLFYSASSGLIALGMNLIRQLRNVQNGMQEYVKWSDAIADAIIAMLLGEFFFCAGTLAASLSSAAIYLALGGSSLIFFMMNCAAAQNDLNTGNYDLAALEFIFAALSVYSAKNCFDNAAAITSAKATAGSTTNPSTDNKQTATEASGNNSPSDNVKSNDYKFQNDKKFDTHYNKHVIKQKEFGNITKEEYLTKCNNFINSCSDTKLVKTAQNGDTLMYDVFTDEFSIITKDGVIRTYYKLNPDVHGYETNLDYWNSDECNY